MISRVREVPIQSNVIIIRTVSAAIISSHTFKSHLSEPASETCYETVQKTSVQSKIRTLDRCLVIQPDTVISEKSVEKFRLYTVRWSNFDRRDPKMGGFLAKYRGDPLRTSS